jgi:hypothetical protein
MGRQKLSMSEKIRNQLALGKSAKEISKYLKCSTGLVYAVKSADKKKDEKIWKSASVSTSKKPVANQIRADILDTIVANKPGAIRYGDTVLVPTRAVDKIELYRKPTFFQRVKNFFMGV